MLTTLLLCILCLWVGMAIGAAMAILGFKRGILQSVQQPGPTGFAARIMGNAGGNAAPPLANTPKPKPQGPPSLSDVMRLPVSIHGNPHSSTFTPTGNEIQPTQKAQPRHGRGIASVNQSMREWERQSAAEAQKRSEKAQQLIDSYEKIAAEKAKGA